MFAKDATQRAFGSSKIDLQLVLPLVCNVYFLLWACETLRNTPNASFH